MSRRRTSARIVAAAIFTTALGSLIKVGVVSYQYFSTRSGEGASGSLSSVAEGQARRSARLLVRGSALGLVLLLSDFFLLILEITACTRRGRRLKAALKRARHRTNIFQSILNTLVEGMIVADENGRFVNWNTAAEQMGTVDIAMAKWTEQRDSCILNKAISHPAFAVPLSRALQGELSNKVEMFVRDDQRPEGIWISAIGTPLKDSKGHLRGGVVIPNDINELKIAKETIGCLEQEIA